MVAVKGAEEGKRGGGKEMGGKERRGIDDDAASGYQQEGKFNGRAGIQQDARCQAGGGGGFMLGRDGTERDHRGTRLSEQPLVAGRWLRTTLCIRLQVSSSQVVGANWCTSQCFWCVQRRSRLHNRVVDEKSISLSIALKMWHHGTVVSRVRFLVSKKSLGLSRQLRTYSHLPALHAASRKGLMRLSSRRRSKQRK